MAEKEKVGVVFTYFKKPMVAGIRITKGSLKVGDNVLIQGYTTNVEQTIDSMQIERDAIEVAEEGQEIGIKVKDRVRPHDIVYKVEGSD